MQQRATSNWKVFNICSGSGKALTSQRLAFVCVVAITFRYCWQRVKMLNFRQYLIIKNCILPVQPSNHALNLFDNLWTYIGYFSLHFPNDWSTNCRPMVATHYTHFVRTWLCIGAVGYHSLASSKRSMTR